jgi:hypothetical protein
MNRFRSLVKVGVVAGLVAVLLGGLGAGTAAAQSVKGTGIIMIKTGSNHDGGLYIFKVTVDAWVDEFGVAQGKINMGGNPGGRRLDVTDIYVVGNTAWVQGIVVSSPMGYFNGTYATFTFTDNSGTDEPDELNGVPIDEGDGYTVED